MKARKCFVWAVPLALVFGCAHFSSTITDTSVSTNGVKLSKTVVVKGTAFLQGAQEIAKISASQGPRTNDQYTGLAGLNQQTQFGTNLIGIAQALAYGLGKAAMGQ